MRQLQTPVFEIELIDFTQKRLNLTHDPKTINTVKPRGSFNTFGKNILSWRKSLIPQSLKAK